MYFIFKTTIMNVIVKFVGPELLSKEIKDKRLYLSLVWAGENAVSIITRIRKGYNYVDTGYEFARFFKSPKDLIDEYALPITVAELKSLTAVNEKRAKFKPSAKMIKAEKPFQDTLSLFSKGGNITFI